MLGIPTVQDRCIQQMLLQVLTPIFDPAFSEHSYGFRPGRKAQDAMLAAQKYAQGGKDWVVLTTGILQTTACQGISRGVGNVPGPRHQQILRPRQSRHSDGPDRNCDPGQAGVGADRQIPATGSDGGGGSDNQRGRDA